MIEDARGWVALPWTMSDSSLCSAHDARVCVWIGCSLPWDHVRLLRVQRTGCSWMLVDGVLSHVPMSDPHLCSAQGAHGCSWTGCSPMGPMSDPHLCSAQGARGCSWMGCSTMDPCATLTCAMHRMLADARGWGALPWTHDRYSRVQRTE